jgi:putative flippase GtrA
LYVGDNDQVAVSAVTAFVASLRTSPDGRRSFLGALVRFGVTGVASVAVDVGVLVSLHSGAGVRLVWATLVAYVGGVIVNYTLNRNWTFQSDRDHRQTLIRYAVMIAINVAITESLVVGLTHIGLYYLLSKLIAVAIIASINFFAGRHWVFVPAEGVPRAQDLATSRGGA